jgi:NAD(P)-dependent dehydrogenase (short-subunit alcohol dehydrogenase family)
VKDFAGKLAVITGGGTGMGRELARQLVEQGCDVAMCDVITENMAETLSLCEAKAPQGVKVSTHVCDVSDEAQVLKFRDDVEAFHGRGYINLLFNNAGIGGGGSFILDDRDNWEKTFGVCWYGVYYCARAFMPLLMAAEESHLINTSSVNGFWASLGPNTAHTAYSSAKFAVKGFSEALINDLKMNAPNVKVSVVMPGHIGTDIAINSGKILGEPEAMDLPDEDVDQARERLKLFAETLEIDVDALSNDDIRQLIAQRGVDFRDNAPMSAAEAATIMLDGVKQERWRILVGEDAHMLDERVRADPEGAYDMDFFDMASRMMGITEE